MFLLSAVLLGLTAALARAAIFRRPLRSYEVRCSWLVFVAFLPQLFAFVLPTRATFPDHWAPAALVTSQIALLIFALLNFSKPGFWLLSLGLILNLTVIVLNGGLMPISPETVAVIFPQTAASLPLGERLGTGKDILLPAEQTRLGFLSDRFLIPYGAGHYVAFSLGDALVACGIILALWALSAPASPASDNLATGPDQSLSISR